MGGGRIYIQQIPFAELARNLKNLTGTTDLAINVTLRAEKRITHKNSNPFNDGRLYSNLN